MTGRARTLGSWLSKSIWERTNGATPGPVRLPQDEGPHRFPVEWWYVVGQIDATDRGAPQRLAFELTVARLSDPVRAGLSGWAALFSFIDPQAGTYRAAERRVWPPRSPLDVEPTQLRFQIGDGEALVRAEDWILEGYDGSWHLRARLPSGEGVDLDLRSRRPAARFGDQGVVDYGGAETMAWYSWTRLEATGTAYDGKMVRPVQGLCWMDHQWGAPHLEGYTWKVLSAHLDNGDDVVAFRLHGRDGAEVASRCARVSPDGRTRQSTALTLQDLPPVLRHGDAAYRPTTRLVCADLGLDLTATPLLLDQTKRTGDRRQAFPVWWEGACDLSGEADGAAITGRAFVEIAGLE